MKTILYFALISCAAAVPAMAESWSGQLVNSDCYSGHLNSNPRESHPGSYDTGLMIRQCRPETKDATFAVVEPEGQVVTLNASSNEKVLELLHKAGKKRMYTVTVTGEMTQSSVKVETISLVK